LKRTFFVTFNSGEFKNKVHVSKTGGLQSAQDGGFIAVWQINWAHAYKPSDAASSAASTLMNGWRVTMLQSYQSPH
jgi:hypothetical protein